MPRCCRLHFPLRVTLMTGTPVFVHLALWLAQYRTYLYSGACDNGWHRCVSMDASDYQARDSCHLNPYSTVVAAQGDFVKETVTKLDCHRYLFS